MTASRRLAIIRNALFNEPRPKGRPTINDDVVVFQILREMRKAQMDQLMRILRHSVSQRTRDVFEAEIEREPESNRRTSINLAADAERYPNQTAQQAAERLRRKAINASWTAQDMADVEGIISGDSARAMLVERFLRDLRRLGIMVTERPK